MEIIFKTLLVFSHFICATFALSIIIRMYFNFLLFYNKPLSKYFILQFAATKHQVSLLLYGLWSTGLLLCIYGYIVEHNFFYNPKLIAKIIVVICLTINGILMHKYLQKYLCEGCILYNLEKYILYKFSIIASFSLSSWLFACFLGVARNWNNNLNFSTIMYIYFTLLLFIAIFMLYSSKNVEKVQKYYQILLRFIKNNKAYN